MKHDLLDESSIKKVHDVLNYRLRSFADDISCMFKVVRGCMCINIHTNLSFLDNNNSKFSYTFYVYEADKNNNNVLHEVAVDDSDISNHYISVEHVVERLLDCAKMHDIVIGSKKRFKLISAGETLESLCIEHDLTIAGK